MGIVSAIAGVASVGLSVAGSMEQQDAAEDQAAAQRAVGEQQKILSRAQMTEINKQHTAQINAINAQKKQNQLQKQAAELDARKRTLEVLRNQQRARALALTAAAGQGAQFGSGLQGGYAQIGAQAGNQALGISQGLGFGEQLFDLNAYITKQNLAFSNAGYDYAKAQAQYNYNVAGLSQQMADAQSQAATGVGLMNLGGSIGSIGKLVGGFTGSAFSGGGSSSFNSAYGTGTSAGAIY